MTPWRRWLVGGLAIATADVVLFTAFWWPQGVSPDRIFRGIAVGLFGHEARDGGAAMTIAGAILHVVNATLFVTIYGLVGRRLADKPLVFGPPYGLVVWAVMTFVVIPLSRIGWHGLGDSTWLVASLLFHAFVVGIGSAWFAREHRVSATDGSSETGMGS